MRKLNWRQLGLVASGLTVAAVVVYLIAGEPEAAQIQLIVISALFVVYFLSGIYVAAALGTLALTADIIFSDRPLYEFWGNIAWEGNTTFILVAVPLFILLGELLLSAGLSKELFDTTQKWVGRIPGGLLHANIATSAVFSAASGSSAATAAAVGSVALPYFRESEYDERMVLGTLAAGGSLGQLIPPGISMIVYALFTGTSVGDLYAAGAVAGAIVVLISMGYIAAHDLLKGHARKAARVSWGERWKSLVGFIPLAGLVFLVLGSLYLGWATPTEAAALGVIGALILGTVRRRMSAEVLRHALRATARITSMVMLIVTAALILNFVLTGLHLPDTLASFVAGLDVAPLITMLVILLLYIVIGTFMDGMSAMITTIGVIFPVVIALGYDAVWLGVVMTMVIEIALISPPAGMVMYVLQGMREPPGPISDVFMGVLPFMGVYSVALLVIVVWPESILWIIQ